MLIFYECAPQILNFFTIGFYFLNAFGFLIQVFIVILFQVQNLNLKNVF